jgi:uncharacterized coiled-coil protein SlyX
MSRFSHNLKSIHVTYSRNILESEPRSCSMANSRLDRLEQQLSNLVTMCEVLMKKMEKNNETIKANNAKLYALVAKFDNCSDDNNDELHCYEQSQMVPKDINNLVNPQDPICHVEVSPPCAILPT